MPNAKLKQVLGYQVFFWSNEGNPLEPVHVHVGKTLNENATKIWILINGSVKLEHNKSQIKSKDLKRILRTLPLYSDELVTMWENYFNVKATFIS